MKCVTCGRTNGSGKPWGGLGSRSRRVQYLGSAVDVVRVSFLTLQQCDMCDVLHWIGQSQQDLALLGRFRNRSSGSSYSKIHHYC